jgi:salicylate hydroxylase
MDIEIGTRELRMQLAGRDIIVIGAGVGGLAAATALAQRQARVRLYERSMALKEVGAGIQIGPNGVAVLEALGLRDAAEEHASLPQAIELRDYRSERRVARLALGGDCVSRYGRPYWHFHRADLLKVLADGAREAGVDIHLGETVEAVEVKSGQCSIRLASGEEKEALCVVAADGLRSKTRSAHFSGRAPRFTGHVAWRGLVRAADLPEGCLPAVARVFMGPRRHLVTYPLRGGSLQNFIAVEERTGWATEGWTELDDPANLRAAFRDFGPQVRTLLEAVERTFLWGLFDHPPLDSWARGHLVLTGDACHPTLPFLAQGAAMALEDAWVLAAELDVAHAPAKGLKAYEARRKPRTSQIQRASVRNGQIYHLQPGVRQLAHLGIAAASSLLPGALIGRLDWLYGADVVSAQATL